MHSEEKSKEFFCTVAFFKTTYEAKLLTLAEDPDVDVNWTEVNMGRSGLHMACEKGEVKKVKLLLGLADLDPNLQDKQGFTPLYWACWNNQPEVVSVLLADPRVDINQPDNANRTPLWCAAWKGNRAVMERLFASGRTIDTKAIADNRNTTALQEAKKHQKKVLAQYSVFELMEWYERDPADVTMQMRKMLGFHDQDIGRLFALVVYRTDGYLRPRAEEESSHSQRFFSIVARLPIEFQMILCNRVFGSSETIVKTKRSEPAFIRYANE